LAIGGRAQQEGSHHVHLRRPTSLTGLVGDVAEPSNAVVERGRNALAERRVIDVDETRVGRDLGGHRGHVRGES
jgi:hypothetical protein